VEKTSADTLDESSGQRSRSASSVAGLALVFAAGRPSTIVCPAPARGVTLGRDWLASCSIEDERASRAHLRAQACAGGVEITDLGSRNGTFVDGHRLERATVARTNAVVRMGSTVLVVVDDCELFARHPTKLRDGRVEGPRTSAVTRDIAEIAAGSRTLLVLGESGVGKEDAAREFHRRGPRSKGPFVAVNCAAVPESLAERLFFGSKQGAFSGSTDAEGYVRAARGGTLFLDELGDLDASLQSKLLRLVESREILPVGAARPEEVDLSICAATNRDLRDDVARGRFREDLYFRLPAVRLPPLRQRREEIPWLVVEAAHKVDPSLSIGAKLVEACLLRAWPGNIRELISACAQAARRARGEGQGALRIDHLDALAGAPVAAPEAESSGDARAARALPDDATIASALESAQGNVSGAAKALGMHRNQLRRWIERRRG